MLGQLDTVDTGLLRGKRSAMFRVTTVTDIPPDDESPATVTALAADAAACHSSPKDCSSPLFLGSDRKAAKLSYLTTTNHNEPLLQLINRLLALEPTMMNHNPAITVDCNSTRVAEEKENIWLEHVFIYVIIREPDGDYHLIVGDGQHTAPETLFNVEISGLPESSSTYFTKLKNVRNKFETRFTTCSVKNFWETNATLPEISIKGTLFFDKRHASMGTHSGNNTIKTKTFWEIHPVTYIKFWN